MKKITAICLTALFSLTLLAGVSMAAKYKAGTYEGSAVGYTKKKKPGKIVVNVTVDEETIKKIELVTFEQTLKGKRGESVMQARDQVPAAIIEKQTTAVDSVTKASLSSGGIKLAVAQALHKATVSYKDGTYTGSAVGYTKKKKPGKIDVQVTIAGGKISTIEVVTFEQTLKGKRGESVMQAKEQVPAAIIEKQTTAVDSVAKASLSSDGIKLAVAQALEKAR